VLGLAGRRTWGWTAPALGLAVLVIVATATIRLPGHGITAAVFIGGVVVAAAALVRDRLSLEPLAVAPTALVVLAIASLPFIANGRMGILGVTVDNDLGPHFLWADALRTGNDRVYHTIIEGYPLGPHSLAGALAAGFGTSVSTSFAAVMLVTPVIAGITALGVLPRLPTIARFVGSLAVAVPYLAMAYFAEGAFKEGLVALFIFAFALELREVAAWRAPRAEAVALGLLGAGAVEVYGLPGAAPLVATAAAALLLLMLFERRRFRAGSLRRALFPTALAIGTAVVCLLPQVNRIFVFHPVEAAVGGSSNKFGGNLIGDISGFQAFGIWPTLDFRLPADNPFHAGLLAGFAALVAGFGTLWWLRRRDPFLPSAAAACLLIYAYVHHTEVPYVSAKTLAIGTMAVMAVGAFALLGEAASESSPAVNRVVSACLALLFVGAALWSTTRELRNAQVGPLTHATELRSFQPLVSGRSTLFLGHDDFAPWELLPAKVSYAFPYAVPPQLPVTFRPQKDPGVAGALDFDSVPTELLNEVDRVVTTNAPYASSPPPNWRAIRRGRWFTVWARSGATLPRQILNEGPEPGVVLDCRRPAERALSRRAGQAGVLPVPVILPAPNWTLAGTALKPSPDEVGFASIADGTSIDQTATLPAGSWDVSVQYASPTKVTVDAGSTRLNLPPNLDRKGPFWLAGTIDAPGGPLRITVSTQERTRIAFPRIASVGAVVFTRAGARLATVPLGRACGRYVDWYRLG
jgi:hypothetical protein